MARRRRFYARDRSGRFARTAGSRGVYKKKSSTARKVAIGVGIVAIGGAVAVGTHQAYRAGGRKGFEYGKAQGIKSAAPLRGRKGKFLPNDLKRDYSQNPYAKGFRPVGSEGRARRAPKIRTVGDRLSQSTRIREGTSPRSQSRNARRASQAAGRASAVVRARRISKVNSVRFNQAQSASQRVASGFKRNSQAARVMGQRVKSRGKKP